MDLTNKRVVVTGGTGSMGSVLIRRILSGEMGAPAKVVVFSRDEAKQHSMRMKYLNKHFATDEIIYENFERTLQFHIGDVRNYHDVAHVLSDCDVVINAAALKQVPTCEYFPHQALLTNCIGAQNIVQAISENNLPVETVIGISTDKACKPVNVMGMTKSIQERIFIAGNLHSRTAFMCVRYGNVIASRGSVVPLFQEQIRHNGPVTLTVPSMTRYLLSIDQAVDTVFHALKYGKPGDIVVPDAPAATMENLAKALIGERPIDIKVTGIRPGEKMHESMVSEEEADRLIYRKGFYIILPMLKELQYEPGLDDQKTHKTMISSDNVLDYSGTIKLLKQHNISATCEHNNAGGYETSQEQV